MENDRIALQITMLTDAIRFIDEYIPQKPHHSAEKDDIDFIYAQKEVIKELAELQQRLALKMHRETKVSNRHPVTGINLDPKCLENDMGHLIQQEMDLPQNRDAYKHIFQ